MGMLSVLISRRLGVGVEWSVSAVLYLYSELRGTSGRR